MAGLTPMERFEVAQRVGYEFGADFFYAQDCWEMGFILPCGNDPTPEQEESGECCEGFWFIDLHTPIPFKDLSEAPGDWVKPSYYEDCTCGGYMWDDDLDDEENERLADDWEYRYGDRSPAIAELQERVDRALAKAMSEAEARKGSPAAAGTGTLAGETIAFAGALRVPRREASAMARAAGGTVSESVGRETTLLVVGDEDLRKLAGHDRSSKHRRAEELAAAGQPIRIVGETEFLALAGG